MILIIAGSRHLKISDQQVVDAMKEIITPDVVVCGECKGPDISGKDWATKRNITVWSMPAPWNAWGKKAGPGRNYCMAKLANEALVFWDGKSPGTKGMIKLMLDQDKPVHIVEMS